MDTEVDKMRALERYFPLALVFTIFFSFLVLSVPSASAQANPPTWDTDPEPSEFDANQGEHTNFWISYEGTENTNPTVLLYINWTYVPDGFEVSHYGSGPDEAVYFTTTSGDISAYYQFWVYVTGEADFDTPQVLEYDIWVYPENIYEAEYSYDVKHDSITVTPREVAQWGITGGPSYAALYKDESENYMITIYNYTDSDVYWDISADFVHSGFSVSPTTGSIQAPSGGSRSWSSEVTPTGEGLVQDELYTAVRFICTHRPSGQEVAGGSMAVIYLSAGENESDFQIWFDPSDRIDVTTTDVSYFDIYVKNLGASSMKYHISQYFAPIDFTLGVPNPSYEITVASGENERFEVFGPDNSSAVLRWYGQDAEEGMVGSAYIEVEDNAGLSKSRTLPVYLVVGDFEATLTPTWVEVAKGGTTTVSVRVKNNKNENTSFRINWATYDPELGIYYVEAIPATYTIDNLGPLATAKVDFTITPTMRAVSGWEYTYQVVVFPQGNPANSISMNLTVKIKEGITTYGMSEGVLAVVNLFTAFTGGDVEFAGYLCAIFFLIIPMSVVGLALAVKAIGKHSGLITVVFALLGIIFSMMLGLIPTWILVFIIAIVALAVTKGYWWGR